jgi:hypothetical protein
MSFEGAHLSLSLTINVLDLVLSPVARETPAINIAELTSPPPAAHGLSYPPTQMETSQVSMEQHQHPVAPNQGPAATAMTAARATSTLYS